MEIKWTDAYVQGYLVNFPGFCLTGMRFSFFLCAEIADKSLPKQSVLTVLQNCDTFKRKKIRSTTSTSDPLDSKKNNRNAEFFMFCKRDQMRVFIGKELLLLLWKLMVVAINFHKSKSCSLPIKSRKYVMWTYTLMHLHFDGSVFPLFISSCYNNGIKRKPTHCWTRCGRFIDITSYHSNSITHS